MAPRKHHFIWASLACMAVAAAVEAVPAAGDATSGSFEILVHRECGLTRYPLLCVSSLTGSVKRVDHTTASGNYAVMAALLNKTILETKLSASYIRGLLGRPEMEELAVGHGHAGSISVIFGCEELLSMAVRRLEQSAKALEEEKSLATSKKKLLIDVQTWLSAALTLQQTCKDESVDAVAANGNISGLDSLGYQIAEKMEYLSRLSSNTLLLVDRITSTTPRRTGGGNFHGGSLAPTSAESPSYGGRSRDHGGFPSWLFGRERRLLQSKGVKANAVVAKDGSGDYQTVSEAVSAASGHGRYVIYVKSGVYKEKLRIAKDGITLIGDGKYSTIIQGSDSVANGASLRGSATITIDGDGFIAKDIGFHNDAGPQGEQAVALTMISDRSVLYRCSIAGYQDTVYALALRQFYRECDIYGTVDFIFGNAAAVFQDCDLILRQPTSKKFYNVILANGRTDSSQNTGFSVQNCRIGSGSSGSTKAYLGRPWKKCSRSVVMQSTIGGSVDPRGWIEWPGYGSSVLKSLYFAEYDNEGPGAGTAGRVQWSGFHVIGPGEAEEFTVGSFISGGSWLPSTGVTYTSGLH